MAITYVYILVDQIEKHHRTPSLLRFLVCPVQNTEIELQLCLTPKLGLIYGKFKKGTDEGLALSPTLHIYGPVGLREFVRTTIAVTKPKTPMDVLVHQLLTPGQQVCLKRNKGIF